MDAPEFIAVTLVSFIAGALLGLSADSDRAFLQDRLVWADKVCEPHGGAHSVDTSMFFGEREVVCKDGTEVSAGGNKGE
jgi:hypothetical protein